MTACVFSTSTDSDGYLHFSTVFPISDQLFHTSFMHSSRRTPMRNSSINLRQNHDQRVSKLKRLGQRIWHAEKSSNQESTNKQQRSFESNLPSQQSFQFQINSFTLLSCTVPGVHQWGAPQSISDKTMISGVASSRDQGSAFDTLRSQVTKNPQTNSKGASKATFLQAIENTVTDPADNQTMCGSKLVKNACAHGRVSMRTTGHKNSKTHAHTGTDAVRICVVMTTHGRDVHALPSLGPNVRRRRTGCLNRYRLQRCGPRSIGKIGQRTKNTRQTGQVKGSAWDEWSRALGLTHWPGGPFSTLSSEKENVTAPMGDATALITKFTGCGAWDP